MVHPQTGVIDIMVSQIGMTDRMDHLTGMIDSQVRIGMIDRWLLHHQTGTTESGGVEGNNSGHDTMEVEGICRFTSIGDNRDMEDMADTLPG